MNQVKPKSSKPQPNNLEGPTYTVKRVGSGYSVFRDNKKVTEENMWPIAMKALERMLRADNEI